MIKIIIYQDIEKKQFLLDKNKQVYNELDHG